MHVTRCAILLAVALLLFSPTTGTAAAEEPGQYPYCAVIQVQSIWEINVHKECLYPLPIGLPPLPP